MIRIFLIDDHRLFREGLKSLLHGTTDMRVIGEVATGREAIDQLNSDTPDIVIADISMPDLNGIEATGIIHAKRPDIRILMLSMHSSIELVTRAFSAGAKGYLLKESAADEVVKAVRIVHAGGSYVCEALKLRVPDFSAKNGSYKSLLDRLSVRERQVLQLVVEGRTSAKIAEMIHISPKSVQTYRSRLMKKLGVPDLATLVKFAMEHHLTKE